MPGTVSGVVVPEARVGYMSATKSKNNSANYTGYYCCWVCFHSELFFKIRRVLLILVPGVPSRYSCVLGVREEWGLGWGARGFYGKGRRKNSDPSLPMRPRARLNLTPTLLSPSKLGTSLLLWGSSDVKMTNDRRESTLVIESTGPYVITTLGHY